MAELCRQAAGQVIATDFVVSDTHRLSAGMTSRDGATFLDPTRSALQKMTPEGGYLVIADVIFCLDEAEDAAVTHAGLIERRLDV